MLTWPCIAFLVLLLTYQRRHNRINNSMATSGRILRALIIGAPGSGKGTISKRLVRDYQLKHLASGDLLRNEIKLKTELGKQVEEYITKGQLVPDSLIVRLMSSALNAMNESWLLDGFPRTLSQAEELSKSQHINIVLNLDVPFDTIKQRLEKRWIHEPSGRSYHTDWKPPKTPGIDDVSGEPLTQREDDKPETVQRRLRLYEEITQPLLNYYSSHGVLASFHGTESDVMYPEIQEYLNKFLSNF